MLHSYLKMLSVPSENRVGPAGQRTNGRNRIVYCPLCCNLWHRRLAGGITGGTPVPQYV